MPKIGRFKSDEAREHFMHAYDTMAAQWPVSSTDIDVETSFGTTYVRRSGSGTGVPILLLPGISGNGQVWSPFIEGLCRDRVVYTPDVIGWAGRSTQTAPLHDGADMARWMVELLDGLGEERIHLAGNSMGAWISMNTAVHHSDRLASVTLFEPGGATFARPRASVLLKFLVMGIRPTPERLRKFNKWMMPGYEHTDEEFAMIVAGLKYRMGVPWERTITDDELARVAAPLLVLFGAETITNDPEIQAARVRTHIPSAEIEIQPGIGHDLLWANPEQVIPRFLDFVDTHDQART
ncbi:alpha/beta fold hydrolase [Rhodococcus sp. NPDC060090]|uniref:alpha/beta fold hydrolase n=1 Tax=Rhodococcus sp. NPDC060090 TaxID=3347056 RepID=UPI003663E375